jgi:MFS transporter, putative metabolite transport protein
VLKAIGLGDNALIGALIGTVVALLGATTGWLLVDRVGRRKILVGPMLGCAAFLFLVSLNTHLPVVLAAFCFFGYLFSYGIMSILPGIYPEEIFPTSVRSAGVGVATAASRAGAAVGTFALPHILNAWGLSALMIIMGIVSLIGGITSFSWAPETNGRALTETSHRQDPHQYGRRRSVLGEAG